MKVSSQLKPITFTTHAVIQSVFRALPFFYDKREAERLSKLGLNYDKQKGDFGNISDCGQYYFTVQITKELIDQDINLLDVPGILEYEADRRLSDEKEHRGNLLIDKSQWVWEYLNEKYPYKGTIRDRKNPLFLLGTKKISPHYCLNIEYFRKYIDYLKKQAHQLYSLPKYADEIHQREKKALIQKWDSYLIMLDNKDYTLVDERPIVNNLSIEKHLIGESVSEERDRLIQENKRLLVVIDEMQVEKESDKKEITQQACNQLTKIKQEYQIEREEQCKKHQQELSKLNRKIKELESQIHKTQDQNEELKSQLAIKTFNTLPKISNQIDSIQSETNPIDAIHTTKEDDNRTNNKRLNQEILDAFKEDDEPSVKGF